MTFFQNVGSIEKLFFFGFLIFALIVLGVTIFGLKKIYDTTTTFRDTIKTSGSDSLNATQNLASIVSTMIKSLDNFLKVFEDCLWKIKPRFKNLKPKLIYKKKMKNINSIDDIFSLRNEGKINETDSFGNNHLIKECKKNEPNIEFVKGLLFIGINVNKFDFFRDTALIIASCNDSFECVKELLKVPKINVNHVNKHGNTALILASEKGHPEVVKELLKISGIDVNHVDNGETALICASENGFIECVKELLSFQGIDVNHANNNGNTALILALNNGHIECIKELLSFPGINVNYKKKFW